MTTVMKLNGSV